MITVQDVAAYILSKKSPVTAMKLQKLCYYAQAWSLVWDDRPLFSDRIEAWANGPVAPALYARHRGQFEVIGSEIGGDAPVLTEDERDTVDAVLEHYGDKSSQWLGELVHQERPWKDARHGLHPGERGETEITHAAMAEYYGSL